jgi:hypothetical protein
VEGRRLLFGGNQAISRRRDVLSLLPQLPSGFKTYASPTSSNIFVAFLFRFYNIISNSKLWQNQVA